MTTPEEYLLGITAAKLTQSGIQSARQIFQTLSSSNVFRSATTNVIGRAGRTIGREVLLNLQKPDGTPLFRLTSYEPAYHGADDVFRNTSTGNLVIVEYKANRTGTMNLARTNGVTQMSERWLRLKAENMRNPQSTQFNPEIGEELLEALQVGNMDRLVIVTNHASGDLTIYSSPSGQEDWFAGTTISLK